MFVISEYVEVITGKDKGEKGYIEGISQDLFLYDVRIENTNELKQYSRHEMKSLFW
jgi:ribosomal protein L24